MVCIGSPEDGFHLLFGQIGKETTWWCLFRGELLNKSLPFWKSFFPQIVGIVKWFHFSCSTDDRWGIFGSFEYREEWSATLYIHRQDKTAQLSFTSGFGCSSSHMDRCYYNRCSRKSWILNAFHSNWKRARHFQHIWSHIIVYVMFDKPCSRFFPRRSMNTSRSIGLCSLILYVMLFITLTLIENGDEVIIWIANSKLATYPTRAPLDVLF